ncbi:MAG TPA: GNAT family N-acetyltransferase [Gemmatimonadaceae bacterium]
MNVNQAERSEMNALASATMHAPVEIARDLGLHLVFDQGVMMELATSADVLALNRIVGIGVEAPASRDQLARLIDIARQRGTKRLFVQVVPSRSPDELEAWIENGGGRKYNRWVRLWRNVSDPPEVRTDLDVRKISGAHALRSGEIVAESFNMPMELSPWFASIVGKPGWTHFGAYDGDKLVSCAAIYLNDPTAWLGFAATLADYRGHGAQGALIRKRIEYARANGCDSVVVETAEQTPDHSAPSYRNMLRFGFTEAYCRQNYMVTL